jgi:hypothetical protein
MRKIKRLRANPPYNPSRFREGCGGKERKMAKWKVLLGSRKFWAAFVGLAFLVIRNFDASFNVPETETVGFVSILAAYILGVALEDGLTKRSNE